MLEPSSLAHAWDAPPALQRCGDLQWKENRCEMVFGTMQQSYHFTHTIRYLSSSSSSSSPLFLHVQSIHTYWDPVGPFFAIIRAVVSSFFTCAQPKTINYERLRACIGMMQDSCLQIIWLNKTNCLKIICWLAHHLYSHKAIKRLNSNSNSS